MIDKEFILGFIILLLSAVDVEAIETFSITGYQTTVGTLQLDATYPECMMATRSTSNPTACQCYMRTGSAAKTYVRNISWSQPSPSFIPMDTWEYTCNTGGTSVYQVIVSGHCNNASPGQTGMFSPVTWTCTYNWDTWFDEVNSIMAFYEEGGGLEEGEIAVSEEEVEDVITNLETINTALEANSFQVALIIYVCAIAISFFLGFKTGITR